MKLATGARLLLQRAQLVDPLARLVDQHQIAGVAGRPDRARRRGRPVVLSANLLVGRPKRKVRRAVRRHAKQQAQVLALQEAGGYLTQIRKVAKRRGYQPPIHAPAAAGAGMNSSVLLLRDDVPVHAQGVELVEAPWTGPKAGIRWPGRGIPWAVADLDLDDVPGGPLERTLIAVVHGPTGRLRANTKAWRAYLRALRRMARQLAREHSATHVLLVGDWNCGAKETDRLSVDRLLTGPVTGRVIGGRRLRIVRTGTPIDYAVTTLPLEGDTGPARGSDHPSITLHGKAAA